jgi:hypothetical protein
MGVHHKPEQKLEISKKICDAYSEGNVTIVSCIEAQGINDSTWLIWRSENKEIQKLYDEAKQKVKDYRRKQLKLLAMNALHKIVKGHSKDELHQEVEPIFDNDGNEIGTKTIKMKRVKKYYPPNPTAVMFVLRALEPTTYRDALPSANSEKQTFLIGGKEIEF